MVANIRGYTANYSFKLINFDVPRWHTLEYSNWQLLDAMLLQAGVSPTRGEWANNTLYTAGDRVFDIDTGSLYRALVTHTSAATGTFAADRLAHPTYWVLQDTDTPIFRGQWATATSYSSGDIVYVTDYNYYLCTRTHVSSVFNTDQGLGVWQLIFDATATVDAAQDAAAISINSANTAVAAATAAQVAEVDWKGPWSAATTYAKNDAVSSGGSSYISTANGNLNHTPPNPTYWDVLAQKGNDGAGTGTGDMLGANNLAEGPGGVASIALSRSNLGLGDSATKNVGTAAGTIAAGDDARITGALQKTGGVMTGNLYVTGADPYFIISKDVANGHNAIVRGAVAGVARWDLYLGDGTAEDASNNGSRFQLVCRDSAGASLHAALIGERATGLLRVKGDPTDPLGIVTKQMSDLKAPITSPTFLTSANAPTPPPGDNDTSVATTAFVKNAIDTAIAGGQVPSDVLPLMNGTAAAGTSSAYSRGDHVHPTDTSRAPVASPLFTGDARSVTPALGDNDTSIVTTAWLKNTVSMGVAPDFNNFTEPGTWYTSGNDSTNGPTAGGYWVLQVLRYSDVNYVGQLAFHVTTAVWYVRNRIAGTWFAWRTLAELNNPAFTGNPTAPTPTAGDNDTSIATTAFVTAAVTASVATQADQEGGSSVAKFVTPGRQQFHASAAKFWGYATVSGGIPALQASYNVTSITDTGVGTLTVTIGTDFSSANWCPVVSVNNQGVTADEHRYQNVAVGSFECAHLNTGVAAADPVSWAFAGYGDQ